MILDATIILKSITQKICISGQVWLKHVIFDNISGTTVYVINNLISKEQFLEKKYPVT